VAFYVKKSWQLLPRVLKHDNIYYVQLICHKWFPHVHLVQPKNNWLRKLLHLHQRIISTNMFSCCRCRKETKSISLIKIWQLIMYRLLVVISQCSAVAADKSYGNLTVIWQSRSNVHSGLLFGCTMYTPMAWWSGALYEW